jgi:FlaG/FlaF family flagellin (archaellin)
MNIKRLRDAAVSPVVGVLLMLVITIIIAAVVSGFAGGLIENKAKAPQVSLRVEIEGVLPYDPDRPNKYADGMVMTISHRSGDPIDTSRTELITSWTERIDRESAATELTDPPAIHYARTVPLVLGDTATYNSGGNAFHQPYLSPQIDSPDESVSWGTYIMKAGDVAIVNGTALNGYDPTALGKIKMPVIKDFELLTKGDRITVRLIDSVTGGSIYEKDIYPTFKDET